MKDIREAVLVQIDKNIDELTWKCDGCPDVNKCQADNSVTGLSKYCILLIKAAVRGSTDFQHPEEG